MIFVFLNNILSKNSLAVQQIKILHNKFSSICCKVLQQNKMLVGCKNNNCKFKISCNKRNDGNAYITTFTQQHTCNILDNQPKVSSRFVAEIMLEQISDNPDIYSLYCEFLGIVISVFNKKSTTNT